MIKIDDTNATSTPSPNTASCEAVNARPNLTSFNKLAPNITGIAKKNVNSAATVRLTPNINPPRIVAPERDVPGKIAAINWNIPIKKAVLPLIAFKELILGLNDAFLFSITINPTPKIINARATQGGL